MTGGAGMRAVPGRLLLLAPATAFLVVLFAAPLALVVVRSLTDPVAGLGNYAAIAAGEVYLRVLASTFGLAATVTLATVVLGWPVAWALARARGAWRLLLVALVLLPFWTSLLVRTYAWMVMLGRYGVVNQALMALGVTDQPLRLLHTGLATHVGMIHILLPFLVLPLWSVMERLDPSVLKAARSLGAGPFTAFVRVWVPLTLPGVVAGALLVFILALGFYVTPALLGGAKDLTVSMLITQQVTELLAWGFASALAVTLLAATLVVLVLAARVAGLGRLWEGLA